MKAFEDLKEIQSKLEKRGLTGSISGDTLTMRGHGISFRSEVLCDGRIKLWLWVDGCSFGPASCWWGSNCVDQFYAWLKEPTVKDDGMGSVGYMPMGLRN